jgi:tetratricopeptide (TPR) repeat protein
MRQFSSVSFRVRTTLLLLLLSGVSAVAQTPAAEDAFRQGIEALHSGQIEAAADAFTQSAHLAPRFAAAYLNLGLVREQQGRHQDAITALQRAIVIQPNLRGANLFLGIAEYRLNHLDEAAKALTAETRANPTDAKAWMWLGIDLLAAKRVEDAAEALNKAAKLAPDDLDILYHRGRALLLLSRQSYEHMFKVDPDSWRVHQVLAQGAAESDRDSDAIVEYRAAIAKAPREPGLHQSLATLLWKTGKLTEAQDEYKTELQIDPDNTLATYQMGCLLVETSNAAQGKPMIEQALRQDPSLPIAEFYLGRANMQLGSDDEAIANFKKMLAMQPDSETELQSYYQLSRLYRRQHHPTEAQEALNRFRELEASAREQKSESFQKRRTASQDENSMPPLPPRDPDKDPN